MADERIVQAMKLVDPTTTSQEAGVDASGNVQIDIAAVSAVGQAAMAASFPVVIASDQSVLSVDDNAGALTVDNAGTFVVQEDGAALTALQLIDDPVAVLGTATYVEATTKGMIIGAVRNDTLAALANLDNEIAPLQVNAAGALYGILAANSGVDIGDVDVLTMPGTAAEAAALPGSFVVVAGDDGVDTHPLQLDASGFLKAILQSNTGVDIGDVDVLTLPADTFAAEAAALGKGVLMQGDDGADRTNVLVDTDGHLQIDVLTGGGSDSPTTPVVDVATSAALAAGSTVDLNSAADVADGKVLWGVDISSSVAFKAIIRWVDNDVDSPDYVVVFGRAGEPLQWRPPHRNFFTKGTGGAGVDVFQVEITNMDTSQAADVYASFMYSS